MTKRLNKQIEDLPIWAFNMLMVLHYISAGALFVGLADYTNYFAFGMYFYAAFMGLIFQTLYVRKIKQEEKK